MAIPSGKPEMVLFRALPVHWAVGVSPSGRGLSQPIPDTCSPHPTREEDCGQRLAIRNQPANRARFYPLRRKTRAKMDTVTLLGLLAGTLTTLAFAPQVVRAWRTRSTADLSLGMLVVLLSGVLLWLAYGVVRGDIAIIAANGVTAVLVGLILSIKKKSG